MERAEAQHSATVERVRLGKAVLLRIFLRSLLLQATWNRRGMQNLGFAYAIWPGLKALYPDEASRARAAARHLAFFNTHPYLASAILGGALFHEERVARGEEPPEAVERFKSALMGPFAAVGDSFFWLSLRPFAGMIAALLAPWIGLWAVAAFLALYNVPHVAFRLSLFLEGYRRGDRVVERVARASLPKWGARLRRVSAVGGGVAVVVGAFLVTGPGLPVDGAVWLAVIGGVSLLVFLGTWALLARRGSLWAGLVAIGIGLVLALLGAGW
ncbi:PTS system mannose/fructose/sorbose family transporter subunit IID [Vulgatibacter sp.]|uniref:PTS system mannose/fructose/sorbose family transporter subunit IID n=1 Tax=Vulgatibacter sp. TaxID=1971226 RepID=UPI00356A355D